MVALNSSKNLRVSTKLFGVVGISLVALCVMGAIAIFSVREIRDLERDLLTTCGNFSSMRVDIAVTMERAIGEVRSAPSELDLAKLQAKRQNFQALLAGAAKKLEVGHGGAMDEVAASGKKIGTAIAGFDAAAKKVFDFAASFAQPDAIAALETAVAPAEAGLQAALEEFRITVQRSVDLQEASIRKLVDHITELMAGLAALLVAVIAAIAYATVSHGVVRPLTTMKGVMMRLLNGEEDVEIPYTSRSDEIGEMAQAVQVFKDNAVERIHLEARQATELEAKEKRTAAID